MLLPSLIVIVAVLIASAAAYTVRVTRRAAAAAQARNCLTELVLDRDIGALYDQLAEARASIPSPSLSPQEEGGSDV